MFPTYKYRKPDEKEYTASQRYDGPSLSGEEAIESALKDILAGKECVWFDTLTIRIIRPLYNQYANVVCGKLKKAELFYFDAENPRATLEQWVRENMYLVVAPNMRISPVAWDKVSTIYGNVNARAISEPLSLLCCCDRLTCDERIKLAVASQGVRHSIVRSLIDD